MYRFLPWGLKCTGWSILATVIGSFVRVESADLFIKILGTKS